MGTRTSKHGLSAWDKLPQLRDESLQKPMQHVERALQLSDDPDTGTVVFPSKKQNKDL